MTEVGIDYYSIVVNAMEDERAIWHNFFQRCSIYISSNSFEWPIGTYLGQFDALHCTSVLSHDRKYTVVLYESNTLLIIVSPVKVYH